MDTIIPLARDLMYEQTKKNGAPMWELTEIAIKKGEQLSKFYDVDRALVLVSLYLAHTVFSPIWKGEIQKNHPYLSADFVVLYLDEWGVSTENKNIILNAIQAHHGKVPIQSKVAEVVKNAECFKFVTVEGSLMLLHELGRRGIKFSQSVSMVLEKMEQKRALLTLSECIAEAEEGCKEILSLFNRFL